MKYLEMKTKPLPLWSKKIPYLKKNEIYSLYELEKKFNVKYNNIRMFFNRLKIKPSYKIIKKNELLSELNDDDDDGKIHKRKISYYNSNNIIKIYLEVRKKGTKKDVISEQQYKKNIKYLYKISYIGKKEYLLCLNVFKSTSRIYDGYAILAQKFKTNEKMDKSVLRNLILESKEIENSKKFKQK